MSQNNADWSKLPIDLLQEILSKNFYLTFIGRQLNKNLRFRLNDTYLKYRSQQKITSQKIKTYRDTIKIMRLFWGSPIDDIIYFYYIDRSVKTKVYMIKILQYTIDDAEPYHINIRDQKLEPLSDVVLDDYSFSHVDPRDIDILTVWRIYLEQKDCLAIDPNYAKNQAIKTFNRMINYWGTRSMTILYGYLLSHLWLFNYHPDVNKDFQIDVDENDQPLPEQIEVDLMQQNIKAYVQLINKYLDQTVYDEKTSQFVIPKLKHI